MMTILPPALSPQPSAKREPWAGSFPRLLLVLAAGAGFALFLAPAILPALAATLSGDAPKGYWFVSRASAFVAYGLLWLSMLAGLGVTNGLARFWPGMPSSSELHRFTGSLGLAFVLLHALVLLGDPYMGYSLAQLLMPFMAGDYRPGWVGFGQLAFYLLTIVALSIYVRNRLGTHIWRVIHTLSFAMFLLSLIHGLQSGSDSQSLWATAMYLITGASVLFCSIYRVLAVRIGRRKEGLAATGLIACAGRAPAPGAGSSLVLTGSTPGGHATVLTERDPAAAGS